MDRFVYPDFPRSNEKPQDFLGFCLKVFTTLVFYVAEGLSDILGGGWSGSVKPRRFKAKPLLPSVRHSEGGSQLFHR